MYRRFATWIGDKPWFRSIARHVVPPLDGFLIRFGMRATPWPTLLLTTTGRNSGRAHQAPLYFVSRGDALAVIASNYGGEEPGWSRNLARDQKCEVMLRRKVSARQARLASTDEWQPIFDEFAEFYPNYHAYRERADRKIPIWILEGTT